MEHKNKEDSRDLKLLNIEMCMYKILYSALEKVTKTNPFKHCLKKKLMFLMNPLVEKEYVNVLELSSDIMSQINTVHFNQNEILLIHDIYFKELPKFLEELSESFIEFESVATALPDRSKSIQTFDESLELAKDIHNLVLDNNSEIENNVQLQNTLIKLKYKIIPGNDLKKIENYEKKELKKTLHLANYLYEETLNTIYPSEDCIVKMKEEVCSLEQELKVVNESIEELTRKKEMYQEVDKEELLNIVEQYKEIKRQKRMVEMTFREIKPFHFTNQ